METNISLAYILMGLLTASALLTYFTRHTAAHVDWETTPRRGKKKKARKAKTTQSERLLNQQPYLQADGTVVLTTEGKQSYQIS